MGNIVVLAVVGCVVYRYCWRSGSSKAAKNKRRTPPRIVTESNGDDDNDDTVLDTDP